MIEYLYDVIKASAGEDTCICAQITDINGVEVTQGCSFVLHDDYNILAEVQGVYDEQWNFIIPAEVTKGLNGRYWYCIKYNDAILCFKQPIYIMG